MKVNLGVGRQEIADESTDAYARVTEVVGRILGSVWSDAGIRAH